MPNAESESNKALSEDLVADLRTRFDPDLVTVFADNAETIPSLELMIQGLGQILLQSHHYAVAAFLDANVAKRRNEAELIAQEIGIFAEVRSMMQQANRAFASTATTGTGGETIAAPVNAAANLIRALATKNSTMGEGVPPTPGGSTPPEIPEDQPETPGTTSSCRDRYQQRLRKLLREKALMGDYLYALKWTQATLDFIACSGKSWLEAAKIMSEIVKNFSPG